jgi:predicted metal-binding membrane protein
MPMNNLQKIIVISLISTAGAAWILSSMQPDMMSFMTTYNPLLISLFTASWTASMAAMMFPAIVPMVLLYNKLITNKQSDSSTVIARRQFTHTLKIMLFIGMYLAIWALTGLGLLLGWSVPMNSFVRLLENNHTGILFGSIMIVSGIYQFTSLKNKCIGYCESPLSFFMRRWNNRTFGAIKMGAYHGLYCLGCCWPYFLIMIALGWMSLTWMGLFALIIFGEKMWIRGIWIARAVGIALIISGVASSLGLITIYDSTMVMSKDMQTNGRSSMLMLQDTSKNNITSDLSDENNVTTGNVHSITPDMNM